MFCRSETHQRGAGVDFSEPLNVASTATANRAFSQGGSPPRRQASHNVDTHEPRHLQETPRMNELKVITLLCVLWMLPQEMFTVPGRSRGGKRGRRSRHHRIRHMLNDGGLLSRLAARVERGAPPDQVRDAGAAPGECGEASMPGDSFASMVDDVEFSDDGQGQDGAAVAGISAADSADGCAHPMDPRVARRVEHLFRLGHQQRAMRVLKSTTGMADLDQEHERSTLSGLHPAGPSALPPHPSDAPQLIVDPAWMASEMRRSDTGAAAGASGWGSNFAAVLANDVPCVTAMAVLVSHIVNNKLPATVRDLLNTCLLVSLVKPGSGDGRRPVAIGDMFYRMAARFALSLVMESAQRALRPHQFGVGVEDGCTQVVQSLQHLLSLPPAPAPPSPRPPHQFAFSRPRPAPEPADPTLRPLACLSIDVANAFNSVDRAAVLRAVYDSPELAQCWRMVAFGYGQPSPLLMPCGSEVADADAFVQSSNGVRQGDPLAALLFALAMHVVYKRVAEICSAGCFAYSDDSHGVGWLSECWRAWEELPALLAPLGLSLNARKCQVTCFHTDGLLHERDVAALEAFRAADVIINTSALKGSGLRGGCQRRCHCARAGDTAVLPCGPAGGVSAVATAEQADPSPSAQPADRRGADQPSACDVPGRHGGTYSAVRPRGAACCALAGRYL